MDENFLFVLIRNFFLRCFFLQHDLFHNRQELKKLPDYARFLLLLFYACSLNSDLPCGTSAQRFLRAGLTGSELEVRNLAGPQHKPVLKGIK